MSRRRARRGPPQCAECRRTVTWLRAPNGNWRLFDPKPVDLRQLHGTAYPVEGIRAWRPRELVEELMGRLGISETDAATEVHDMPWHQPHTCPTIEGGSIP